jgi:hypothetical protein
VLDIKSPIQGIGGGCGGSLKRGEGITEQPWYAGIDWASESHHVFLTNGEGRKIGEKIFRHGGEGLAVSRAAGPDQIHVAIEVPHGPVVETLIERSFKVHAINPKQMDRFRDRFTLAGAKDDSRDAEFMASALRTDPAPEADRIPRFDAAYVLEVLRKPLLLSRGRNDRSRQRSRRRPY